MPGFPTAVPPPRGVPRPGRGRYDAVVVGSGIGGCVCAARLAQAGLEVAVLEKNPKVGGILASYEKGGFKIDQGSHLVSRGRHGAVGQALWRLGLDRPRFLTHRIPVRSRGIFHATAPPSVLGLPAVALQGARDLGLPLADAGRLAVMLARVFTLSEPELATLDGVTLDAFVRRYTEHPGAYFLFSFLASIFFILPPWEVSAGEAVRALRMVLRDYGLSYVEGGMDAVPHVLLSQVVAAGGEVVTGARVVGLRRLGDVLQVTTDAGDTVTAPAVVANLPPPVLLDLLEPGAVPEDWVAAVRVLAPSGNAHQLKVAVDRKLVDEGCLIGGVSLSGLGLQDLSLALMRRTVDDIAAGRASDPLAIYAPVPTNFDPTLAPPGHQLILASVYGPTGDAPADDPEVWKDKALAALAQVVPGLMDHLVFADLVPVPAVARWMGRPSRGAIATGQRPGQVGRHRIKVATPVPGLFVCGDGAGGRGVGTELAAASGWQAAHGVLAARAA